MKKIIALLCLICIGLVFTGCEGEAELREAEKQGRINAVNYIKEKYGVKPRVLDVRGEYISGFLCSRPNPEGPVEVTMRYRGKEFTVSITGTEPSIDGVDDYQCEEISTAIEARISEVFRQYCENAKIRTVVDQSMYHTAYDGSNIAQIMQEQSEVYCYVTAFMDLETLDTAALMNDLQIREIKIVNCTDLESYQNADHLYERNDLEDYIEGNGIYLKDYITIRSDGSKDYVKLEKVRCGNLVVIPSNGNLCEVTEMEIDPGQWEFELSPKDEILSCVGHSIETEDQSLALFMDGAAVEQHEDNVRYEFLEKYQQGNERSNDDCLTLFDGCWYRAKTKYSSERMTVKLCFMEIKRAEE